MKTAAKLSSVLVDQLMCMSWTSEHLLHIGTRDNLGEIIQITQMHQSNTKYVRHVFKNDCLYYTEAICMLF
jgi:hypothetical protein